MKHSEFCLVLQETILITMRFLTFSLALLFIGLIGLSAQDVRDIDVATTDDKIIITYNLFGKKNKDYQVDLLFKKADGSEIRPKALTGDIGKKVQSGKGKSIVWDLYKDVDELEGSVEPIISVKEPIEKPTANFQTASTKKFNRNKRSKSLKPIYKIGWGRANVTANQNHLDYYRKRGFETGMGLRWNIAKRFFVQPEALYRKHSFKEDPSNLNGTRYTNKLHYVKSQLMFGLSPFRGGLYFNAGPYASYLFAAKRKVEENTGDNYTVNLFDTTNPFERLDYGYSLGVSLDFNRGNAVFGFLFTDGLNNIIDQTVPTAEGTANTLDLKNRSYNFYISFGF